MAKKPMTDLDKKLQEMALLNWHQFVALIGEDSVTIAKICLLRRDKRSYEAIKRKLDVTYDTARYHCSKCPNSES